MAEHSVTRQRSQKAAMTTDKVPNTREDRSARIEVLTGDPHRNVVISLGCHLNAMRNEKNVFFFEDGNALVGMIVHGGTVEYRSEDRTYVVHLTNGLHPR